MSDLDPFTPALELASAVRRREVSPVELVDLYLDRIDRLDPDLNAFCFRADDDVRRWAEAAAQQVMSAPADELPPFLGVPIPIKDLNEVEGWTTTFGSRATPRRPSEKSDLVVERLVAAGFIPLGLTNAPEFGTISYTESDAHGVTRNPWNRDHTPGGSSGGAAAAVAAGMAPIAHGNDGGGSIRIPSSTCGLVGLKASRNRVSNGWNQLEGLVANGTLCRTTSDVAATLDVLSRPDPLAWYNAPPDARPYAAACAEAPARQRVVVMTEPLVPMPVDQACLDAVDATVHALADLGHEVVDVALDLPDAGEFITAFTSIWDAGSVGTPVAEPDLIEPLNQALRASAQARGSLDYAEAVRATQLLSRQLVANFGGSFDVLVTPTMAVEPPPCGSAFVGADEDPMMVLLNCYPMGVFTTMFNVTGLPAISVPVQVAPSGLPVGVQLVAGPWRDDLLLQLAHQLEGVFAWQDRRPPGY